MRPASSLLLSAIVLATTVVARTSADGAPTDGCDADRLASLSAVQEGDLLLRRGTDMLAGIVLASSDQARFSHVGVVVRVGSEFKVVHASPPERPDDAGVRIDPLASFVSGPHAADLALYRAEGLDASAKGRIRRYLVSQLGKPFDYAFRFSEDSALYCTELALRALEQAGVSMAGALQGIRLPTLDEAAFPPDALRFAAQLRPVPLNPASCGPRCPASPQHALPCELPQRGH